MKRILIKRNELLQVLDNQETLISFLNNENHKLKKRNRELQEEREMYQNKLDKIKNEIEYLNKCEYNTNNLITCIEHIESIIKGEE